MDHLSEGQLQAYADGELEGAAAHGVSAHVAACEACAQTLETLRSTAVRASAALAIIDRPAPTAAAYAEVVGAPVDAAVTSIEAHRSWGRPARVGFLKAAMLALFASGAAAAAIPGSPVQRWLGAAWERLAGGAEPAASEVERVEDVMEPPAVVRPAAEMASISIEPVEGTVQVLLVSEGALDVVRVTLVDGANATVEAESSDRVRFRTGPSLIEARGLGRGVVTVALPRGLARAVVRVDGQLLLEKDGAALHTPGSVIERSGDTILFRAP